MAACVTRSYTSISEIVSISSKPLILKLWFAQHCWYYSHCLQLHGLNDNIETKRIINKGNINHVHLTISIIPGNYI